MRKTQFIAMLSALAATLALPTVSQADDWDLDTIAKDKLTVASLSYDTGLTMMIACRDDQLNVILSGLPRAEGQERTIIHHFPSKPEGRDKWVVYGDGTTAYAAGPTQMSRNLMAGGAVSFSVPTEDGTPAKTYAITLPENSDAVRQVMQACGRPLVRSVPEGYPNDDMPFNPNWTTRPNPTSLPFEVSGPVNVYVSCQTGPQGRVQNCYIDSAHPWIDRLNQVILRQARRAVLVDGNTGLPYPSGNEFLISIPVR
ncbi:hypothetical protein WEU32_11575 [Brevundimonas sp. BH3]|uniref:hypothetical protein n=1 Tax=unclassified Brevundimonas TaxID=2622653 RepID=UPI00289B5A37|nr:hypothetical protein [Brevundimonas sp.]